MSARAVAGVLAAVGILAAAGCADSAVTASYPRVSADPVRSCYVASDGRWDCYLPADVPAGRVPVFVGPESATGDAFVSWQMCEDGRDTESAAAYAECVDGIGSGVEL